MRIPLIPTQKYLHDLWFLADLSDEKIGKAVGLTRTSVWRLRTGKHKFTCTETGIRIANFHARMFRNKSKLKANAQD